MRRFYRLVVVLVGVTLLLLDVHSVQGATAAAAAVGIENESSESSSSTSQRYLTSPILNSGFSQFLSGNLGWIDLSIATPNATTNSFAASPPSGPTDDPLKDQGTLVLKAILVEFLGGTGLEEVRPAPESVHRAGKEGAAGPPHNHVRNLRGKRKKAGNGPLPQQDLHIRFYHYIDDLQVEGAAMMMHISGTDGIVYAVNGEYAPILPESRLRQRSLQGIPMPTCEQAMLVAITQMGTSGTATMESPCVLAAVYGDDGYFQKAWKALIGYDGEEGTDEPYQLDEVFASLSTGELVARFPTVHGGGRSLQTSDCHGSNKCSVVSTSSNFIKTGSGISRAAADAHNYAIFTYNYYFNEFNRNSIDNKGMKLISRANYEKTPGTYYNNAFWDGTQMTYGDGDPSKYYPFSRAADVVGHELTHGVTGSSSNLIYKGESGAINEAMSDVFGVTIKRLMDPKYKTLPPNATWLLGSDLYRYGGTIRNMADPAARNHVDYYNKLYKGTDDNGGVHNNSGIMNLAFSLSVTGGSHPRNLSKVVVPAIDPDFDTSLRNAARIWYYANTACLTRYSAYVDARRCTLMFAANYTRTITTAWNAVGVFDPNRTTQLTIAQCLQLVKKSCTCNDYITNNSTCWFTVAKQQCKFGVTRRQKVHSQWTTYCSN